jgi:hypothetical protein
MIIFSLNLSPKIDHIAKLLIGNAQNGHQPSWWQKLPDPPYMHIHAFAGGAMPVVNRKLHHSKSILFQVLAKPGSVAPIRFQGDRQIKEDEQPHNVICIKPYLSHLFKKRKGQGLLLTVQAFNQ